MARERRYTTTVNWTGNLGEGTADYRAYKRDHEISGAGKQTAIPGSSDPLYRGDAGRYNPEELLVAAASACHMLWMLHLCAEAGLVVTEYVDHPEGVVAEHADGSGEFTSVTLHPRITITDASRAGELDVLHHKAHAVCAIARSVQCDVSIEPVR